MEARELRIGNILMVAGLDRIVYVNAIFNSHFRCVDKDGVCFSESIRINYQPIPITEEWLERFGFNGLSKEDSNGFELIYNNVIGYRLSIQGQYQYKEIKYIHELQNLYFALTGKELELKQTDK